MNPTNTWTLQFLPADEGGITCGMVITLQIYLSKIQNQSFEYEQKKYYKILFFKRTCMGDIWCLISMRINNYTTVRLRILRVNKVTFLFMCRSWSVFTIYWRCVWTLKLILRYQRVYDLEDERLNCLNVNADYFVFW